MGKKAALKPEPLLHNIGGVFLKHCIPKDAVFTLFIP